MLSHAQPPCTGPTPWNQLEHPAVRQLAWAIGAPPIVERGLNLDWVNAETSRQWLEEFWGELLALEVDPEPLVTALSAAGPLLGKRFEALLAWYFDRSPNWTVHVANGVVERGGQTQGEVDFIVESADGEIWHVEVACKFYLAVPGSRGAWSDWRGLRVEDTLERKAHKFHRQLQLRRSDWPVVDRKVAMLKGWLFYPFKELTKPHPPRGAAASAPSGWWLHADEVVRWDGLTALKTIPRWNWLMQVHEAGEEIPLPLKRGGVVAQAFHEGDQIKELSRGMVVPNQWPH